MQPCVQWLVVYQRTSNAGSYADARLQSDLLHIKSTPASSQSDLLYPKNLHPFLEC